MVWCVCLSVQSLVGIHMELGKLTIQWGRVYVDDHLVWPKTHLWLRGPLGSKRLHGAAKGSMTGWKHWDGVGAVHGV